MNGERLEEWGYGITSQNTMELAKIIYKIFVQ